MIYLIDNGYRIMSALNTLVSQVKCPEVYNKCLGCEAEGNVDVNANNNVNQGTCFADVNDKDIINGNANVNDKDNDADVNENVNGETWTISHNNYNLLPSLSDDTYSDSDDTIWSESRKYINIFSKTKQRDKICSKCECGGEVMLV